MDAQVSQDEIRALVRELLREAVAAKAPRREPAPAAPETGSPFSERIRRALETGGPIEVRIDDDRDLNAFAQSIALCALERELLGAVASNRVRFRLAGGGEPAARAAPPESERSCEGGVFHWDEGVLNETRIAEISGRYAKLVLGAKAVLTPLAKDRARECKLEVVRRKP